MYQSQNGLHKRKNSSSSIEFSESSAKSDDAIIIDVPSVASSQADFKHETSTGTSLSASGSSRNYHWQLLILFSELTLASFINWIGVASDWAIALGCEIVLTVLYLFCPKNGGAGEKDAAARICLVCGVSSFCWITVISNRSSAFLPFEFGAMVFLPAISALMKTGFTWFFGERELQQSDLNAVFKFYRYHFLWNTDKIDNISSELVTVNKRFDGLNATMIGLNGKVDGLEDKMIGLNGKVDGLEDKISS